MNPDRRLALHAFGVPLMGAGLLFVFPTHPVVGWGLIGLGLSLSAYAELKHRYPALASGLGRVLPWRPAPPLVDPKDEWLTLAEAVHVALSEASLFLDATTRGMAKTSASFWPSGHIGSPPRSGFRYTVRA